MEWFEVLQMWSIGPRFLPITFLACIIGILPEASAREFLTNEEIEKIQDAQEIDLRTKVYLSAAALRLKEADNRLRGIESAEGDPLEFFTAEDMLDGYYRIIRSVMFNLDDAFQGPGRDRARIKKALQALRDATKDALRPLEILKKTAEDKQKEELWNLVNEAIDITTGAYDGAEFGLSKIKQEEDEIEQERNRSRSR